MVVVILFVLDRLFFIDYLFYCEVIMLSLLLVFLASVSLLFGVYMGFKIGFVSGFRSGLVSASKILEITLTRVRRSDKNLYEEVLKDIKENSSFELVLFDENNR